MTLTSEQRTAVQAGPHGAFLIAAGPGTGKTFTMVERFLWLVAERRLPPESIFAVTFTERAASELRQRVAKALERLGRTVALEAMDSAWIGTFHALCARLLREHAYLIGVPREIRVLDEVAQQLLVRELESALRSGTEGSVDFEALTALGPDEVSDLLRHGLQFVLKLKGRGITPQRFRMAALELHRSHRHDEGADLLPAAAEEEAIEILHMVYDCYEKRLRDGGYHDFDDLILTTIGALEQVPALRQQCRERFRHLLVDEFQDSNRIQLELIRLLAADGFGNVTVVGDARQSIYGWRDAEIDNIRTRFPGRRLPLTRNRRSYQEILDCAGSLIRRDPDFADEPDLVAERGSGGSRTVTVMMAPSVELEARLLGAEILRLRASGVPYSAMAVLAHSVRRLPPPFEQELRRQRIPYVTSAGAGLFDREEVKDVLALLRLVEEPMHDGALVRVLCGPLVRMDDASLYPLALRRAGRRGMRLRDCLDESAAAGHPELDPEVARRGARVLQELDELSLSRDSLTVSDLLNRLLAQTGYQRHSELLARRYGPRAILNLRKVSQMASGFERDRTLAGLADFISHLDEVFAAELPVGEAETPSADALYLLTVHAAKGLEFDVVFLVNTKPPQLRDSQRLFFNPDGLGFVMKYWRGDKHPRFLATTPSAPALKLQREERRRAVYVALTRARDRLYVTASRSEGSPEEVSVEADDHFAEILTWALANPASATVVTSEQLGLPALEEAKPMDESTSTSVAALMQRLRLIGGASATPPSATPPEVRLSFSQLHQFEVCPIRYEFAQVLRVPAPPDELLPKAAARAGGELGSSVHAALRAWHEAGGDLLQLYRATAGMAEIGPQELAEGLAMLEGYLLHPMAAAPTLGTEAEFNLRLGSVRIRGVVDRICTLDGRTALIDYKTNRSLDARLLDAYSIQLRLYGLAAATGVLPGGSSARLLLFDLRHQRVIEVEPDPRQVEERVSWAAEAIRRRQFRLGPEHADRPCFLCSYRPICPSARV